MSNAMNPPGMEFEPCSTSSSPTSRTSVDGATTTPSDLSTPSCTSPSSAMATNFGSTPNVESPEPSLAQVVSASDYPARVSAVVEMISQAPDQPTVLALLRRGVEALGAQSAVFISFVRDNTDLSACRFMLACEPRWCQEYLDKECIAHDPWLAYAAHHSAPIVASSLEIAEPEGQRVIALALQNGFASAVLVPAHSGAGHSRVSLLCLGSSHPGFFEGEGFGRFKLGARTLAAELHDWWLARVRRELVMKARITRADLELLRHQHQGHCTKQIADELRVSKSSINSRFQRMNVKLGVPNRRMAVRLAVEYGLL